MSLNAVTTDLDRFLSSRTPKRGRLQVVIDRTGSRGATWDMASRVQMEMFNAVAGGLDVQLIHFGGGIGCPAEFTVSPWFPNGRMLAAAMAGVNCLTGETQIGKALAHAKREHQREPVHALILIGDAFEEDAGTICDGLPSGLPIFAFQEGHDPAATEVFSKLAELSGGAHCAFDAGAAQRLRELLQAVAAFATGGLKALMAQNSAGARLLLTQLKSSK